MNKRYRTLLLMVLLLLAMFILAGCAVQDGPVNLSDPNASLWQRLIVFPLVKLLMIFNTAIASVGIPYSWGWAIILLTVLLKIVTLPLTRKQLQSTKATQELQPRLAELQAKHGKDRQKLSEEQMKLYKEAGVNPMGGCLPLLIQMPILFGLYQALYILAGPGMNQLSGARFFWIPDLAFPNQAVGTSWISASIKAGDWATLFAYFSLPVLMLVSQIIMQKMSQAPKSLSTGKSQSESQTQMMNSMMMFMPLMFGYITLGLPSGLTLYWTTSNLLSMVQQYFVAGWGGMVDWFPRLKARQKSAKPATLDATPVTPATPATSATTVTGSAIETTPKPEKRRRRKK